MSSRPSLAAMEGTFCTPPLRSPLESLSIAADFIGQFLSIQVSEDSGVRCDSIRDQVWKQNKRSRQEVLRTYFLHISTRSQILVLIPTMPKPIEGRCSHLRSWDV